MKFFFILGCHRSGTTMLQQALNRHSAIIVPPETKYFSSFLGHSPACQAHRLQRINRDLGINVALPRKGVTGPSHARAFFLQMADQYARRLRPSCPNYFGEKTPAHSGHVARISSIFPEAKLLWIFRDGRDVACSLRRVGWAGGDLVVGFLVWLYYYFKQARAAHDQILFIRYEDVVSHPVREFRRITDFLGLPFESTMALGHGNLEGILPWELAWKQKALEPIRPDWIESWRAELSPQEIRLLERLGGGPLRRLGYALNGHESGLVSAFPLGRAILGMFRLIRQVPLDDAANQLCGRAFCCRSWGWPAWPFSKSSVSDDSLTTLYDRLGIQPARLTCGVGKP